MSFTILQIVFQTCMVHSQITPWISSTICALRARSKSPRFASTLHSSCTWAGFCGQWTTTGPKSLRRTDYWGGQHHAHFCWDLEYCKPLGRYYQMNEFVSTHPLSPHYYYSIPWKKQSYSVADTFRNRLQWWNALRGRLFRNKILSEIGPL